MTTSIDRIARSLAALEKRLSGCTRCGACQAVCPVFSKTGHEADVARGKLALLDGLAARMFDNPDGVLARLDRCLLCGACAARCPANVEVMEIFSRARFIIKDVMGLPPLHRLVLRMILASPRRLDRVIGMAARLQRLIHKKEGESFSVPLGPSRIRGHHFVPIAPIPFREMSGHTDRGDAEGGETDRPKVVFFTGCLLDKFFPHVAGAAVTALTQADVRLIIPPNQGCCGMPALSMGDSKTFSQLLRYHLNALTSISFDYLVTACATCGAVIKTLWPNLSRTVAPELAESADVVADKSMDITRFLTSVVGLSSGMTSGTAPKIPVTYHDSCHLRNSLGLTADPRRLIQANPRFELVEMEGAGDCCGMGGTFHWRQGGLSTAIGAAKRERILDTGASIVATSCPACMIRLTDLLAGATPRVAVKHVIELYAGR